MKEILKRILGYFEVKRREKQGPSLLGMETQSHRDVPDAETIKKAVEEAKEVLNKNKHS